jgi:branched-chain amino acid transport system substrate-binding protein
MPKSKATIWIIVLVVVIIVGLFWWKNNAQGNVVKVGFIGPLTGNGAVYGEPFRNVVALAVDEINTSGGVSGKKLQVIYEDGKCTGTDAANAMNKLVSVDGVQVVLGGFCTGESAAIAPIATANKVALLSPGSTGPTLTGISPYFFRDCPSASTQSQVFAQIAFNGKKWKKIAVAVEQTDFATGVYNVFNQAFSQLGGTVTEEAFTSDTTDFRSILLKLKGANPDALFIDTQASKEASIIVKQMQDIGWKPHLILSNSITGDPKFLSDNKNFIDGALTAKFGIDATNPKFVHLIDAYKQKYGSEPAYEDYAQTDYDAVYLLRDAISQVGYDGSRIADWLRTVKNWPGASGQITMLANGDRDVSQIPQIVQNGVLVPTN